MIDRAAMQRFAWPLYLLALVLVAAPLFDLVVSIRPFRPGDLTWRFGALGLVGGSLPSIFIGGLLAHFLALGFAHRRIAWLLSVCLTSAGLLLLVASGLFALDAIGLRQLQADAPAEAQRGFDLAALRGFAVLAGFSIVALWIGGQSLRILARGRAKASNSPAPGILGAAPRISRS